MKTKQHQHDAAGTRTVADLLEAVDRLRHLLEANSATAEADRALPDETVAAMREAGLFDMLAPRAVGGLELHPAEALRVFEAVARIDSAAAWNLVMNQAVANFAAWLPADGAAEVFGGRPTTVAGAFFPPGTAVRSRRGWRITSRVSFASGCSGSEWIVLPALETRDGVPRTDPATGGPIMFGAFVPRGEVQVYEDSWHVVGMRGTGSFDVAAVDVFVPERRIVRVGPLVDPAPGFEGPLFRMFPWPAILGEATVSVGVAAAAVEELVQLARAKTPAYTTVPLREQSMAQHAAARAKARVDAARDTLHRAACDAYDDAATGTLLSWASKTRLQLAACFAAEASAEAVRLVHDAAGSSAIRIGQRFERHFRDAHVLTQHTSKSSARYATVGRLLFGLENDWPWLDF